MLTVDQIARFVSKQYPRHLFYQASVEKAEAIAVHAEGLYSEKLMDVTRPNEDDIYKLYRKLIFKSPTKKMFGKVTNSLAKIEKSEGWSIAWPAPMAGIPEKESFDYYMNKSYPGWDSFDSFYWNFLFTCSLKDPNAVFAIHPESLEVAENEYFRPIVTVFSSDRVIDYRDNELAVLLSLDKSPLREGDTTALKGNIFYIYDRDSFCIATQVGKAEDEEYSISRIVPVPFGYMPAFKAGSFSVDQHQYRQSLYNSIVQLCLDDWDEAVRRYSDHQVHMVKTIHPREWELATDKCQVCESKGYTMRKDKAGKEIEKIICKNCQGTGKVVHQTIFGKMRISPTIKGNVSEMSQMPLPPFGSGSVDVGSLQFIKDEVKDKIYEGLQALNMEDLMERPSTASNPASGISKMIDRSDKETFIFNVARYIVDQHMSPLYYFHAVWRYGYLYTEDRIEKEILPKISIPKKFDVVTTQMISERLVAAKNADLSDSVKRDLEKSFIKVEFGEDSPEYTFAQLCSVLDPLPGKSIEEITLLESSGMCTKQDAIISANLAQFITRAMKENADFAQQEYARQKQLLETYATEIITKRSAGMVPLDGEPGLGTGMDTPTDVEAEAKAKLKGTVGGVQGILQIQASVSEGKTTYEAAVAMLVEIYGFTDELARRVLGDPKPAPTPAPAPFPQPANV